jgi:hypothetical protein
MSIIITVHGMKHSNCTFINAAPPDVLPFSMDNATTCSDFDLCVTAMANVITDSCNATELGPSVNYILGLSNITTNPITTIIRKESKHNNLYLHRVLQDSLPQHR